jgi:hypothetical protein
VGAELGDPAVLDHGDTIGVMGGEEPVGDRDDRTPLQHRCQRALQMPGSAGVDQRGRLVQHQGVRVSEDEPGQGDLLGLRCGQGAAPGADLGIQTFRERRDPFAGIHRRQGVEHLRV